VTPAQLSTRTYVALVHHPVYDKHHHVVATSITNLDIHDIARSCKTYGLAGYFLVHPVAAQRELARRIVAHWQDPRGREQNDSRSEALSLVHIVGAIEEAIEQVSERHGTPPLIVGTTASLQPRACTPRQLLDDKELSRRPLLLLFGTGWGLVKDWIERADRLLLPIRGSTEYNHLSVRTAAGIFLDRLFAETESNFGEHSV
jgi:hypothetical protein